jgi:hypothetical protein
MSSRLIHFTRRVSKIWATIEIGLQELLRSQWLIVTGFSIVLGIGLYARLAMLKFAQYPGHGDHAFYYSVAENVVAGKGLTTDYIWTYLSYPESITHTSHDFWMPLTSIIISLSLYIFGNSLSAALLPSIFTGLALSIIVYFLGKKITDSKFIAFCSSGIVLFMPHLFSNSLLTDSPVYYAFFVSAALLFMVIGQENPRYFLLSAILIGVAHLTRQDGILLFLTLVFIISISQHQWKRKLILVFLSSGLYLLVLSPLLISNLRIFGLPFPPGPSRSMFVTDFEDVFSYSKELSLKNHLTWGMENIIGTRVFTTVGNVKIIYDRFLGTFLKVFTFIGILILFTSANKDRRFLRYLPAFLFFFLLFSFYSLIVPISSGGAGFTRSSMSLIPILVIIAVDTLTKFAQNRMVVVVIILLIAISSYSKSVQFTYEQLEENRRLGLEMERLNQVFAREVQNDEHDEDDEIVIMTRNPWQVYHTTRHKTIQIPNEDLETIYSVAIKYGADYLLLPAPRDALVDLCNGTKSDERFLLKATVPDSNLKLFKIEN